MDEEDKAFFENEEDLGGKFDMSSYVYKQLKSK